MYILNRFVFTNRQLRSEKNREGMSASQIVSKGKRKGWRMVTWPSFYRFVIHLSLLKETFNFLICNSITALLLQISLGAAHLRWERREPQKSEAVFSTRGSGCISLQLEQFSILTGTQPWAGLQRNIKKMKGYTYHSSADRRHDLPAH